MSKVTAESPSGKIFGRFKPKQRFTWVSYDDEGVPTLHAVYLPKYEYMIRSTALLQRAREWQAEGKVSLIEY